MSLKIESLAHLYVNSVKDFMCEIDRHKGVLANYMISMVKSLKDKENITYLDVMEETHNYACDFSPWLKDVYPYKLMTVYDYYKGYYELSQSEKDELKELVRLWS